MKFGKHIRSVAYEPWADRYVDYKGLKKLLKPLENHNGTPEEESIFLSAMHSEIDKVSSPPACISSPLSSSSIKGLSLKCCTPGGQASLSARPNEDGTWDGTCPSHNLPSSG